MWQTAVTSIQVAHLSIWYMVRFWKMRVIRWVSAVRAISKIVAALIIVLGFALLVSLLQNSLWLFSSSGGKSKLITFKNFLSVGDLFSIESDFLNGKYWSSSFRLINWFQYWTLLLMLSMKIYQRADFGRRILGRGVFPDAKVYIAEIDGQVWNLLLY